jgi:hypothetical protein
VRRRVEGELAAANILIGVASLPAIANVVRALPLRLSLDTNEGWNAYQVLAATRGTLYPHPPLFFFNNYPPLSFFLVAPISSVIGDPIVAGRVLALVAFAALSAMTFAAARQLGCAAAEATFGAVLFVAVTLSLSHYVGIDDPQFVGQAVSASGLLFLLPRPRVPTRIWMAAALMTMAVFIKHNVVALPLACVFWLWKEDRPAARRLITAGVLISLGSFMACVEYFGIGLLEGLATPRGYSLLVAVSAFARWIVRVPVFLGALLLLWRRFPGDSSVAFCMRFVAMASLTGIAFLGGDGVDWNVMFESNWAWCLTAAVALNRLTGAPSRQMPRLALAAAFALLPIVAGSLALRQARRDPGSTAMARLAAARAFEDEIAFVANRPGPALCDDSAVCFWAGKPAIVDVFNLRQYRLAGRGNARELDALVERGYFGVIQVKQGGASLGPDFQAALDRHYVAVRQGPAGTSFVPRDQWPIREGPP